MTRRNRSYDDFKSTVQKYCADENMVTRKRIGRIAQKLQSKTFDIFYIRFFECDKNT